MMAIMILFNPARASPYQKAVLSSFGVRADAPYDFGAPTPARLAVIAPRLHPVSAYDWLMQTQAVRSAALLTTSSQGAANCALGCYDTVGEMAARGRSIASGRNQSPERTAAKTINP